MDIPLAWIFHYYTRYSILKREWVFDEINERGKKGARFISETRRVEIRILRKGHTSEREKRKRSAFGKAIR